MEIKHDSIQELEQSQLESIKAESEIKALLVMEKYTTIIMVIGTILWMLF
jgi:hypothetical protein